MKYIPPVLHSSILTDPCPIPQVWRHCSHYSRGEVGSHAVQWCGAWSCLATSWAALPPCSPTRMHRELDTSTDWIQSEITWYSQYLSVCSTYTY